MQVKYEYPMLIDNVAYSVPSCIQWMRETMSKTETDVQVLLASLKACTRTRNLERGKRIHAEAVESGHDCNIYIVNTLINMYAKCSSMFDARDVFNSMTHPTVVSWNVLILGYAANGQGHAALDMFIRMRTEGPDPDAVTLVASLKACNTLAMRGGANQCRDIAKEIHSIAVGGCNVDVYLQSTLIDVYANCGSMVDAREVFDSLKNPDVVSWTALISGYAVNGQGLSALDLFTKMKNEGFTPDKVTMVAALKACSSFAAKDQSSQWGKQIHNLAVEFGCNSDVYLQSTLINMFAKCNSIVDARGVFDSMNEPDVISWNVMILGYADNGQGQISLALLTIMRSQGPAPNSVTCGAALRACSLVGALEFGRTIHSEFNGKDLDVELVNCLVDFYAKCGSLMEAQSVFDLHAKTRNVITWNALLAGYSSCGDNEAVFQLFERMQNGGFWPDGITLLCVLMCCSHAGLVMKGKECFETMWAKYGVIPTVKHYTCMIDLYGRTNKLADAMSLLKEMPCSPDDVTWTTILGACRKSKNVEIGRLAYQSLVDLNDKDACTYMLMEQIYWSRGMMQEQGIVMRLRKRLKSCT